MKRFTSVTSIIMSLILLSAICLPALRIQADATNLITNPSVETANGTAPANWTPNSWGANTTSLEYKAGGHTGNQSLYISTTASTSGDAKWAPDSTAITANQSYTYTDYYQSSVATELDAQYTDASGNISYVYLKNIPASSAWAPATVTFTTPATAAKVSILHILAGVGTLQTDDFNLSITQVVTPPANTDGNLILNPSFETANGSNPVNWQTCGWGANTTAFSYLSNDGHTGTHSVKVQTTSYTNGDAKWCFNQTAITPGAQYTFSDYYKSTIAGSIVAQYDNGSGSLSYQTLSAPAASAANWQQSSITFTAPATAKYVTVFHLIAGVGSLQVDDASLLPATVTPPPPPPSGNRIANPSLETADSANSKLPANWVGSSWGSNTSKLTYLTTGHTGTRSVKAQITSFTSGAAFWDSVAQPVTVGQMYEFSDYFEANIPSEIDATITMNDGSVQYVYLGDAFASPNSWTKFDTQFTAPAGAVSVSFEHNIFGVGWLTTDDFSLTPFSYQGFNRPIISITDDDGYASYYNNGLPVLKKYGLTATDYIISGYVGNTTGYMSKAQVKALYTAGHEIGSHSVSHPDLTTLTATKQDAELKDSQSFLQTLIGVPVTDYAAPYGAINQQVVTNSQKYYQSYRGVGVGYNAKNNFNVNNIMVQNMVDTTTLAQVQSWIAKAKATNTWLVLVYHEINPNSSAGTYNTYPADFDAQMSAVKASGIPVETMSQALKELKPQL